MEFSLWMCNVRAFYNMVNASVNSMSGGASWSELQIRCRSVSLRFNFTGASARPLSLICTYQVIWRYAVLRSTFCHESRVLTFIVCKGLGYLNSYLHIWPYLANKHNNMQHTCGREQNLWGITEGHPSKRHSARSHLTPLHFVHQVQ